MRKGEPGDPLVLADLKNSQGFREFLEQEIAKYSGDKKGKSQLIVFVERSDAVAASAGNERHALRLDSGQSVCRKSEVAAASGSGTAIAGGGHSSFTATPFRNRIAQVYQEGAGLVVAANLGKGCRGNKAERMKGQRRCKA